MDYKIDPKQVRDLDRNLEKMKALVDIREVDPETLEVENHRLRVIASSTGGVTKSYVDSGDKNNKDYVDSKLNTFSTVAKTGSYNDLKDKPDLKPIATSGDYNDLENKPSLKSVATTGNYSDLTGRPNLQTVATTGSYNDLKDKPPIPTLDTSTMVVFKKIYEYVVDDFDKGQELVKEIPIDFTKYRKIIIDAHYEATNGSVQRWDLIQPIVKNPPMTLAKCWQVGVQHDQTSRATVVRELDQVLAVWTVANNASSYHLEMMVNNDDVNFPMYYGNSFGGIDNNFNTQEINGRIKTKPSNITALKVMLNKPQKGGFITVYGVEK